MTRVEEAQRYLQERNLDGWLLYDFRGSNPLARSFLQIGNKSTSRRFFYWIPAREEPVQIVHAIEANVLNALPGIQKRYASWQSLESLLASLLQGKKRVAMEYSPRNSVPYVSLVDGGTIDLVRSFGVEVVSSADFLASFTSVLSEEQIQSQKRAASALSEIVELTWNWIREHLSTGRKICEWDVQQKILQEFEKRHLRTDHSPIVAVNAHSADPHYEPAEKGSSLIAQGDFILIDLWAKEKGEKAVYGDITRVAVAASAPSAKQKEIFSFVRQAQKAAIELVKKRFQQKKRVEGWEVDEAAREVIRDAGFAEYFIHRTGHSIETVLHGTGAHMDNLEMHDIRPLLPLTCCSIEPGIYLPAEFGVRLECDLLIHKDGFVEVTGGEQESIKSLL